MSRRLRRLPILILPLVLATTLAACGSDSSDSSSDDPSSSSSGSADALQGIKITGDIGKEPTVAWNGALDVSDTATSVVTPGDGAKIVSGNLVDANIWIGNGTTQKKAYSDYDNGQPEQVTASDSLSPVFKAAVLGQTIGSRIAVTTTAEAAFGTSGNTQLGIGNKDTVLIVVDLMKTETPPKPKDVPSSQLPSIIEKSGKPTGFDFSKVDKPKASGDLLRSIVKEGDGAAVTADQTLTVNYLGEVYGAKAPFDESYSKQPADLSLGQVIKGWTYGLTGVKVGSRVLLQIPPALGYGSDTSNKAIPANSTLYFVIDIVSAK